MITLMGKLTPTYKYIEKKRKHTVIYNFFNYFFEIIIFHYNFIQKICTYSILTIFCNCFQEYIESYTKDKQIKQALTFKLRGHLFDTECINEILYLMK